MSVYLHATHLSGQQLVETDLLAISIEVFLAETEWFRRVQISSPHLVHTREAHRHLEYSSWMTCNAMKALKDFEHFCKNDCHYNVVDFFKDTESMFKSVGT